MQTQTGTKLLLFGEYSILNGGCGLTVPIKYTQRMTTKENENKGIRWFTKSINVDYLTNSDFIKKVETYLISNNINNIDIYTKLDYPINWGLGSSAGTIVNLCNIFKLNRMHFYKCVENGSGYDVLCIDRKCPTIYQDGSITETRYIPKFKDNLYFVYLGNKSNTANAILESKKDKTITREIDNIIQEVLNCNNLQYFNLLIREHETMVSKLANQQKAKDRLFKDYFGEVKSLGAWGGDFVLATSNRNKTETFKYFERKGMIIKRYSDFIYSDN
jgi:mevalonate kinase